MPKPKKGESESDFVSRYMGSEEAKRKFPDEKQRAAVAYSEYSKRHKKSFHVNAPITKCWEEEVVLNKAAGQQQKSSQRFIEVTVSGLREDRDSERMSQEAIDDMIMQFKSGTIPFFPDHGRDEKTGQSNVYSWKQMMGVWVDGRQENDRLMAVVRLNNAHPDSETFWKFVQEGMPMGFSIGGRPKEEPKFIEADDAPELTKDLEEELALEDDEDEDFEDEEEEDE